MVTVMKDTGEDVCGACLLHLLLRSSTRRGVQLGFYDYAYVRGVHCDCDHDVEGRKAYTWFATSGSASGMTGR